MRQEIASELLAPEVVVDEIQMELVSRLGLVERLVLEILVSP